MAGHLSQHCTSNIPGQANQKTSLQMHEKALSTCFTSNLVTYLDRPARMWGRVCRVEHTLLPGFPSLGRLSPPHKTWAPVGGLVIGIWFWWNLIYLVRCLHCPAGTGCFGCYHDDDADCCNIFDVDDADDCWWSLCWVSIDTDVGNWLLMINFNFNYFVESP